MPGITGKVKPLLLSLGRPLRVHSVTRESTRCPGDRRESTRRPSPLLPPPPSATRESTRRYPPSSIHSRSQESTRCIGNRRESTRRPSSLLPAFPRPSLPPSPLLCYLSLRALPVLGLLEAFALPASHYLWPVPMPSTGPSPTPASQFPFVPRQSAFVPHLPSLGRLPLVPPAHPAGQHRGFPLPSLLPLAHKPASRRHLSLRTILLNLRRSVTVSPFSSGYCRPRTRVGTGGHVCNSQHSNLCQLSVGASSSRLRQTRRARSQMVASR